MNMIAFERPSWDEPVFCRDCKHYRRDFMFGAAFAKCSRKTLNLRDEGDLLVHPKYRQQTSLVHCSIERKRWEHLDNCGPEARYFVPRRRLIDRVKEFFRAQG